MSISPTTPAGYSSTPSSVSTTQAVPEANNILQRARVLETIRQHMPLTTLMTPELRIDLGVFINDQILFRRIVEFSCLLRKAVLLPLKGLQSILRTANLLQIATASPISTKPARMFSMEMHSQVF